jgi:hypothetical protein
MAESTPTAAKSRSRLRRLSAKLLLLAVGILVALTIAEVGLRISGFTYFNPYIVDPSVGYSLRPNAEGWWQREGRTYVKINSNGFRDRERSVAKPPNTFRIAVLGDSYAEAFQVPLEDTFFSVAEQKLQQCPAYAGKHVEVLNFGISGFSTGRELILLRERVWQYSPDLVVVLVTTGNDIRDNSRTLNEYSHQPLPYFVLQDGKLVLDNSLLAERNRSTVFRLRRSFAGKVFIWLQSNLRLLGLIYSTREAYDAAQETNQRKEQQGENAGELGLDSEVYREPPNQDWVDAWLTTEALLRQMRDEVQSHGAQFVLVTGSMGIQDTPDLKERSDYARRLGVVDLFYPDLRIAGFAYHEGIKVLSLAPTFADYAHSNSVYLHGMGTLVGRGHWNTAGHKLAGDLIAQGLCGDTKTTSP